MISCFSDDAGNANTMHRQSTDVIQFTKFRAKFYDLKSLALMSQ